MTLTLIEIAGANFRTSREADGLNDELGKALGLRQRYAPARLALARSLALDATPPLLEGDKEDRGRDIKGDTLFGGGPNISAWVAMIVEADAADDVTKGQLQDLVARHWHRGVNILWSEWNECDRNIERFIRRLCDAAGLQASGRKKAGGIKPGPALVGVPISVRIGEQGTDTITGEPISWPVNAPGGSPHVAIMGEVGTGKTRTARAILGQIRTSTSCPMIAFDLKGDLRDDKMLSDTFDAAVIHAPEMPVPLDVLSIDSASSTDFNVAAERFRESVGRITPGKFGAIQLDALREAALRAMRNRRPTLLTDVRTMLQQVYAERNRPDDGLIATFNELCSYNLFDPKLTPEEFFSRSWILTFPKASEQVRRMVCYLTLDALDRWLNGLPDAPTDALGNRALRSIVLIDEAHRVLGEKQPALVNLVRMSRSKGGVVMLVSQSPDDFSSEEDDFLANVGLCLCFRTKAKPGAVTRMLGQKVDLAGIPDGVCVTRLKNRPGVVRIQSWSPKVMALAR